MKKRPGNFTDLAFTPAVKAMQKKLGVQERNAELARQADRTEISPDLAAMIKACRSFFLATAAKSGQPYIQHRGGPPGFLAILDSQTLAFPDLKGNRQYITLGNLSENPAAMILIVDFETRRRVKIWGEATIESEDRDFVERVTPPALLTRVERAIRFRVSAWDANCPSYIPQLLAAETIEAQFAAMAERIDELEKELARARTEG